MPVLTLPRKPQVPSLLKFARQPLRVPVWAVVAIVGVVGVAGFLTGRKHPAHHYVSYFGYPMVLDTTTGKACYAVPPQAAAVRDAAYPIDGADTRLDSQTPSGPAIPVCGQQ